MAAANGHDRSHYQGKNLAVLLLAMGLPAALLYLRILLGTVADYSRTLTAAQNDHLVVLSNAALAAFCVVQILCAIYIQRLVPPRKSKIGKTAQYIGVLALSVVLSITGAVLFEAFGVTFLMRAGHV